MTILEVLKMPDSDIARSGIFVKMVFKEYQKISGEIPDFCDCKLRVYLQYIRNYYDNIQTR